MEKCCDPTAPIKTCVICARDIRTCEREEPVNNSYLCPVESHNIGWEYKTGVWVCSRECEAEYTKDV